jgi:hypothetical protein
MTDAPPQPPTPDDDGFVPPLVSSGSYQAPTMPDLTDLVEGSKGRSDSPSTGVGRGVVIGGVVGALILAGGAFVAGRAMAAGPATLVDAVAQAQAGTLPCGTATSGAGQFVTRLCGAAQGGAGQGGAGQGGTGQGGIGQGGFGGRGVAGSVTAVSAASITVTTRGGSVTVAVPSNVAVSKTVDGSLSDVKVGDTVTVASTTDANGNRTASRITIVPAGQFPAAGDGPGAAPAPSTSG